ncbi:C4-dicarboxylate ABC transporter [Hydrogenophaga bisanensis]|uniref:C4-dicarboxylate ABC transporter n=1 Tax=Hydrogenophaga bisanensis TaxID=439611 RepID=A0ABW2RCM7_9BURK
MSSPTPLKFLMPGWFAIVMGLCGLSLAWYRAQGLMGEMAAVFSLLVGLLALVVAVVLLAASLTRWQRYPQALAEDLKHPVRHAFVAAIPVSLLLLAAVGVAHDGASGDLNLAWQALWWAGSLTQLWATVWVLGRWLAPVALVPAGANPGGLWPSVTPVLLIPVVGNVVVPLAGLPLGHELWSMAQFGIGAFLWPIVIGLVLVRRLAHSPLPDRILPAWFITIAPPSVIGVVLMQMQAPLALAVGLWGVALFFLVWLLPVLRRIATQPFSIAFWGLSFPLAALATLTLLIVEAMPGQGLLQTLGVLLLAASSIVIIWLCFATVRGLRDGTLLAPEPVATITPTAA